MSIHTATISWANDSDEFVSNNYSRAHRWAFDGGVTVMASSSPQIVPEPMSVAANVDPEEAFVASVSSCHMLWFLSIAAKHGICITTYSDEARGTMGKNSLGQLAMLTIELRPKVTLSGGQELETDTAQRLHSQAHKQCFIANSVHTKIHVTLGNQI